MADRNIVKAVREICNNEEYKDRIQLPEKRSEKAALVRKLNLAPNILLIDFEEVLLMKATIAEAKKMIVELENKLKNKTKVNYRIKFNCPKCGSYKYGSTLTKNVKIIKRNCNGCPPGNIFKWHPDDDWKYFVKETIEEFSDETEYNEYISNYAKKLEASINK